MNPTETIKLLRLVAGYHPGFVIGEQVPAVWCEALADVDAADATRAVHQHYAVAGPWITVADIRRRVVAARGLLPPDPEAAYAQARRMNTWLDRRVGPEPEIHPAAIAAAREIGWSTFDGLEGVAHRRFVEAYGPVSTAAAEKALTTPLPVLLAEAHAPKALPGGSGVEPEPLPEAPVADVDPARVAELHRQIARASVKRAPAPPRADYDPPSEVEQARQMAALRRWARENGQSVDATGDAEAV